MKLLKKHSTLFVISLICCWCFPIQQGMTAEARKLAGTPTYTVSDGKSFVFGRAGDLSCIFDSTGEGVYQSYEGSISKNGLNVGATKGKVVMVWSVLSSATKFGPSALSGSYVGVATGGTKDAFGGEDGLIGGPDGMIKLTPLQTQSNADVNFAIAIAKMVLKSVRQRV